jgi:hypothetical protein
MSTTMKIDEPSLQLLLILLPSHPVHSRRCLSLERVEAVPKQRDRDMVK